MNGQNGRHLNVWKKWNLNEDIIDFKKGTLDQNRLSHNATETWTWDEIVLNVDLTSSLVEEGGEDILESWISSYIFLATLPHSCLISFYKTTFTLISRSLLSVFWYFNIDTSLWNAHYIKKLEFRQLNLYRLVSRLLTRYKNKLKN